jgi:hypothetical protein
MIYYHLLLFKSGVDHKNSVLEREYKSRASRLGVLIHGAGNLGITRESALLLRRKA